MLYPQKLNNFQQKYYKLKIKILLRISYKYILYTFSNIKNWLLIKILNILHNYVTKLKIFETQ